MIAGRDDDDALFVAVGPVGEAAAGELARRLLPADAFVHPLHPERLAVLGIDRRGDCGRIAIYDRRHHRPNVVGRTAKYFPHNADLCFYLIHLQYTRFPAKQSTYLAKILSA